MFLQDFIFSSGIWLGEGKITFVASSEFIKFYTKWEIIEKQPGILQAKQVVEMKGIKEQVINQFIFKDIQPQSFTVILENESVQQVTGKGIRDDRIIAWEFQSHPTLEGFENYEKQENGDFFLHAEYGDAKGYRTQIEGLIWQKKA